MQRLRLRWTGAKRQARLVTLFRQTTLREITSGKPPRGRIPKQRSRGGAIRSNVEAAVMVIFGEIISTNR
ncbi:MAG: hypothetical protein V3U87_17995 [Methylococcaceae bacterium]